MAEPHESRIYSDLAHFYDTFFSPAFLSHEHEVVESLKLRPGQKVLEVGVGTGMALDAFPPYVRLMGIDPSDSMLSQAREKVRENGWSHIELAQGDALKLDFPDDSFDDVVTFHVITVVPDPVRMMEEMIRVCKPGGRIVVVNHFASANPVLYFLNTLVNPLTKLLGWTTRLRARDILHDPRIRVEQLRPVTRFSMHDLIIARKAA